MSKDISYLGMVDGACYCMYCGAGLTPEGMVIPLTDDAEIVRLRAEPKVCDCSTWSIGTSIAEPGRHHPSCACAAVMRELRTALLAAAEVFKVLGNECIGITYRHEALAAEVAARAAATGGT